MKARQRFPKVKYPFSDELCDYMDKDPDFKKSLKISNLNRFLFLGVISTSFPPPGHPKQSDQVIGLWYADTNNIKKNKPPYFKQDFIVNIDNDGKRFVSYTIDKYAEKNKESVLPIKDFFKNYGNGGKYYHKGSRWEHHYDSVSALPEEPKELQVRARRALKIFVQD